MSNITEFMSSAWSRAAESATAGPSAPPSPPMSSPLDRMPFASREKMFRFAGAAVDAEALAESAYGRLSDAQSDLMAAEARLRALDARPGADLNDAAREFAQRKAAAARETVARLRAQHEQRVESTRPVRDLAFALDRYIERELASVAVIEPAPPVATPSLKAGESFHDAIARQRARIEKLRADLQGVLDAPQPSAVAKARAREEINRLAERGAPGVMSLIESREGRMEWPQNYKLADVAFDGGGQPVALAGRDRWEPNALALTVWLHRDELMRRIEDEIDRRADDACALDDATRQKKVAQAHAAILDAERLEEKLIELAEESGALIPRRPDCDPRAILNLSDAMPPSRSMNI